MSTSAEGLPEGGSVQPSPAPAPRYTPDDRVAPEDASLLWPEAHLLAEAPPGYRPLEMPAPWDPETREPEIREPEPAARASAPPPAPEPWPYAPYAPTAQQPPAPEPPAPRAPAPGYVISAPYEGAPAASPERTGRPVAPGQPPVLRSFRDLRTGPLERREFSSMKDFAVAAVLEAGHAEADVARLFRFAPWQLRAWVDEARGASFGPGRGHGPGRGQDPA
ncbi:hypothetical protein [Microbacterium sp. 77mftsu3.1]|uniref:hypothetical protein n=1 Tax=Microbacterium sp. 77mftsu3.1 TaxID=1761802 RepID=UPI0021099AE8|nr:hypothetical protein [Microbacterium sp. 77mftsu3.1]